MGRHTDGAAAGSGSGRRTTLIVVALLLLALLAFLIWPWISGSAGNGDSTDPPANSVSDTGTTTEPTPTTTDAAGTTTDAAGTTTDDDTESSSDAPTETTEPAETTDAAGPPEALTACASEVAAGDELASVASVGAANWTAHFTASVDYNAGRIDLDEANEIFGTTKANVAGEVADYEAARTAYDEAAGGCAEVGDAEVGAEFADAAADCTTRATALSELAATADKVNGDWASHGAMMAAKADTDINDYMAEWHHDVAAAPENMDPYDDAVAALEDAPACSVE